MSKTAAEWLALRRIAILLGLAAFALYLPTLFHSFFADDHIYLAFKNKLLRNTEWHELYRLFWERANPWEYLPLRDLSYWLDLRIYGTEGVGLHFSNLAWYGLSAASAWFLFREIVRQYQPAWAAHAATLAWCGTAVFLVHPAHVEAVAWVASRKDLMSATFAFLATFVLVRGIRLDWRISNSVLAAFLLLCASFSKAAGVTIVMLQMALILAAWRTTPASPLPRKLFALLLLLGVAALAAFVHMQMGKATGIRIENPIPTLEIIERSSRILASLIRLVLLPDSLGIYHDVYALGAWHWLLSCIALISGLLGLASLLFKPSLSAFGLILLLAPCSVYLQLLPFATWSLASERFIFMSVAGLSLIIMDVCVRISAQRAIALLLLIFLPCSLLTWERVADWEYPITLHEREYERQPLFHNAIRDRIIYSLLPQKEYVEAERIAATAERLYAADVLKAFIVFDRASRNRSHEEKNIPIDMAARCHSLKTLQAALSKGRQAAKNGADITYGNLLNSLQTELNRGYPDIREQCKVAAQD